MSSLFYVPSAPKTDLAQRSAANYFYFSRIFKKCCHEKGVLWVSERESLKYSSRVPDADGIQMD